MGTPTFTLIYDRRHRATSSKEGAIELRITYNRIQKHATTGVRVLPRQWKNGYIVNRLDALELQHTLDIFVANARKVVNEQMEAGTLDMQTIVAVIGGKQKQQATENVPGHRLLMDYFRERSTIRKHGLTEDNQQRYDRFLKWFEAWGRMVTFDDITDVNILKMDEALDEKHLKDSSKWNNYHRFLNSFILDSIDDGLMSGNPYKRLHINKDKESDGLEKCLTKEELNRIANLHLPTEYLKHARDLFVFQTYTCMAYIDLSAFNYEKVTEVNGRLMYSAKRGKTKKKFTFLLMKPALQILKQYDYHLPMMSNQKYNNYIKMLAVMAGIDKPVSCHWARHTGATMLLNSGVEMEIISKVLGHSSTRITRAVYAKMLDETVADAMAKVERSLFD